VYQSRDESNDVSRSWILELEGTKERNHEAESVSKKFHGHGHAGLLDFSKGRVSFREETPFYDELTSRDNGKHLLRGRTSTPRLESSLAPRVGRRIGKAFRSP